MGTGMDENLSDAERKEEELWEMNERRQPDRVHIGFLAKEMQEIQYCK